MLTKSGPGTFTPPAKRELVDGSCAPSSRSLRRESVAASVAKRIVAPRKAASASTYLAEFPDAKAEAAVDVPAEDLEAVFRLVDADGSGYIETDELRDFLRRALGRNPSTLQLQACMGTFDRNRDRRISLDELVAGWPKFVSTLAAVTTGFGARGKPKFKSDSGPQVLGSGKLRSTSQIDFGMLGEVPGARAAVDPARRKMRGTTDDVSEGTAKATRHLPGYMGFVPQYRGATVAAHQSFGTEERDSYSSKTNLVETMNGRMSGYSGYVPKGSSGVNKPATATDLGESNVVVAAYWEARARRREATSGHE
jgi:hypothetical protein